MSQFSSSHLQFAIYGGHLLRHIKYAKSIQELELLAPSVRRFLTATQKYDELPRLRVKIIVAFRSARLHYIH